MGKFAEGKVVKREMTLDGMNLVAHLSAEGVSFYRKGDRHRGTKASVTLSWSDILGAGEELMGVEAEAYLGFRSPVFYGRLPGQAPAEVSDSDSDTTD